MMTIRFDPTIASVINSMKKACNSSVAPMFDSNCPVYLGCAQVIFLIAGGIRIVDFKSITSITFLQ